MREPNARSIDYAPHRRGTPLRTVAVRLALAAVLGFAVVAAVVLFPVVRQRMDRLGWQRACATVPMSEPVSVSPGGPLPVHAAWQQLLASLDGGYRPEGATLFVGVLRHGGMERIVGIELTGLDRLGTPLIEATAVRAGSMASLPVVTERETLLLEGLELPLVARRVPSADASSVELSLRSGDRTAIARVTLTEAGTLALDGIGPATTPSTRLR